jgi:hypothetical protein
MGCSVVVSSLLIIRRVREWVMVFNATFNNISTILWHSVFIGGGNWSTLRKPTYHKSLTL